MAWFKYNGKVALTYDIAPGVRVGVTPGCVFEVPEAYAYVLPGRGSSVEQLHRAPQKAEQVTTVVRTETVVTADNPEDEDSDSADHLLPPAPIVAVPSEPEASALPVDPATPAYRRGRRREPQAG